jgi:hypothetical protein
MGAGHTTNADNLAGVYANLANSPGGQGEPLLEIFNFEQTQAEVTNTPNRLGFFGAAGAPNGSIVVGQHYQRTHRTDHLGTDLGEGIAVRFSNSTLTTVSGVEVLVENVLPQSGVLLARFKESNGTAVITQNAKFRAINLNASHAAPDTSTAAAVTNVVVYAAELANTIGFAGNTSWTQIDATSTPKELSLQNQSGEADVHDWSIIISVNPSAAGRKIDWAFYLETEFL